MAVNWLLLTIAFVLIPINIYIINFSEWLTVVLSVFSCCGLIVYLIVFKTKLLTKILLPIIFCPFVLSCSFAPFIIPYWNSYTFKDYKGEILNYDEVISYSAAESDMNALKYYLEKVHPMFQNGLTEEIEHLYEQSLENLRNADKITVNDLRREIQTVLHPMHDAHTSTYNSYPNDQYLKTAPQKENEGYFIISVNGKSCDQIIEEAKPYYSYENENWINVDLNSLASLEFYGFCAPFTFIWSNGENKITEVYTEKDFVSYFEYCEIYKPYEIEKKDFVCYEIDKEKNIAVLTLTQCNYNDTYIDCVNNMFTEVKEKGILNVAVDLRGNGGGSSLVANEFIKYLPVDSFNDCPYDMRLGFLNFHSEGKTKNKKYNDLIFLGNVYVLTNNSSFSSAKDFAMLIQDNNLGKIIGQPSANLVNGYGEVICFYLQNTGMYVQISSKKWYRINTENPNEYVIPDFICESEDVFNKLDELISH